MTWDEGLGEWGELAGRVRAERYANALIAIVGQPWEDDGFGGRHCPECYWYDEDGPAHHRGCTWLIAARALGVA